MYFNGRLWKFFFKKKKKRTTEREKQSIEYNLNNYQNISKAPHSKRSDK